MQRPMSKSALMKLAVSSLMIAAVSMVGCSGSVIDRPLAAAKAGSAGKYAHKAEKALAERNGKKAVAAAESAVAAEPNNAAYRTLLGRSYLLDGRFVAAETAFSDAVTLGNRDPRTIVSLALVQTASGKGAQARQLLADNRDSLPSADYGLALTLAGDAEQGVQVLTDAARSPDASAKTRQNLAYALALSGRWPEAQLVASKDLSPEQVRARVVQWMSVAMPGLAAQRVALLTGVTPRADDDGMPVALALASSSPVQTAAVEESAPVAAETPTTPTAIAAFAEPPLTSIEGQPIKIVETAAPAPTPAPKASLSRSRSIAVAAAQPAPKPAASLLRPVSYGPVVKGGYVIQLGAFDSLAVAKERYARLVRRNAAVSARPAIHTRAIVNGRSFYRLAVGGFADRSSAISFCSDLRTQGGACFVRGGQAANPRWAALKPAGKARPQQFASR